MQKFEQVNSYKFYNSDASEYDDLTFEQKIERVHKIEDAAIEFLKVILE